MINQWAQLVLSARERSLFGALTPGSGITVPKRRLPELAYPFTDELMYQQQLLSVSKRVHAAVRTKLMPKLGELVELYTRDLRDEGEIEAQRADAKDSSAQLLAQLIRDLQKEVGISAADAERMALTMISTTSQKHAQDFSKSYGQVLPVNPLVGREKWLKQAMGVATRENVGLIQSIPQEQLRQVERIVSNALVNGHQVEEIADKIYERFDVSDNRAMLIARDQVGKWHGSLQRLRQVDAGVNSYEWSTSRDERVRSRHREREGKVFRWDEPPDDGHPGIPIQCRCVAIPVFDDAPHEVEPLDPPARQPVAPKPAKQPVAKPPKPTPLPVAAAAPPKPAQPAAPPTGLYSKFVGPKDGAFGIYHRGRVFRYKTADAADAEWERWTGGNVTPHDDWHKVEKIGGVWVRVSRYSASGVVPSVPLPVATAAQPPATPQAGKPKRPKPPVQGPQQQMPGSRGQPALTLAPTSMTARAQARAARHSAPVPVPWGQAVEPASEQRLYANANPLVTAARGTSLGTTMLRDVQLLQARIADKLGIPCDMPIKTLECLGKGHNPKKVLGGVGAGGHMELSPELMRKHPRELMSTMVHENIHTLGGAADFAYAGSARNIEEAITEELTHAYMGWTEPTMPHGSGVNQRRITLAEAQNAIAHPYAQKSEIKNLVRDAGTTYAPKEGAYEYQRACLYRVVSAVKGDGDLQTVRMRVRQAGIAWKQQAYASVDDAREAFIDALSDTPAEREIYAILLHEDHGQLAD